MTWMGVKYAPLLGFIIGLFNVIPYFGAIVAVIIAIVITIFTGGIGQALWLGIIITVLQQIDANIINPRILGTSLNLSPILVIFSVTIGGAYFGVLGMFLGVPVTAFLKIIIEEFLDAKIAKKNA
jgi:predicted PurR-regulated permease PerM